MWTPGPMLKLGAFRAICEPSAGRAGLLSPSPRELNMSWFLMGTESLPLGIILLKRTCPMFSGAPQLMTIFVWKQDRSDLHSRMCTNNRLEERSLESRRAEGRPTPTLMKAVRRRESLRTRKASRETSEFLAWASGGSSRGGMEDRRSRSSKFWGKQMSN